MTAKPCPTCGKPPHDPRNAETWGPDCACECPRPLTAAEVDRICGLVSSAYDGARLLAYVRDLERTRDEARAALARLRALVGRAVRPDCGCDVCVDAGAWRVTP